MLFQSNYIICLLIFQHKMKIINDKRKSAFMVYAYKRKKKTTLLGGF